jgi:hypothetical protein
VNKKISGDGIGKTRSKLLQLLPSQEEEGVEAKTVALQRRKRRRQIRLRRRKKKSLLNLLRSWTKLSWLWLQNPKAKIHLMLFPKGEMTSCILLEYYLI